MMTKKLKNPLKRLFKKNYLNMGYIEQLNKRGIGVYY